ncbi:uncharacterized protein SPPG_05690 [Spizellomyces punctatus DAOM BR117]|uniref:SH3 domain-containing protein n=1 Tax=Spizellomyces punctatus (strain DAOM BR117) TaxID=645134 RepID=A0A0L0HEC0_SPIPD|nr:uncharacterized protein SPPG_05690 [Spizellomyces punctatus DAOM BR117]KNC99452.1 hypothetical protein SPPG_05690 [Spizellomyces punctatus DAOM BR117]|eukprot:XP_016607492.1 hypothetical protein SPPG_05690 [Spizellomyces punctatus DAOM BR117]
MTLDQLALVAGTVVGSICAVIALGFSAHTFVRTRFTSQSTVAETEQRRSSKRSSHFTREKFNLPSTNSSQLELTAPVPPPEDTLHPCSLRPPSVALTIDTLAQDDYYPIHTKSKHKRAVSVSSRFSVRSHSYNIGSLADDLNANLPLPACHKAIVSEPYEAFEDDEMELKIGDLVNVFKVFEDGWGWGVNVTSGAKGIFPVVCLSNL